MGLTDPYGAGLGPAGYAPLPNPSAYVPPVLPVALRYDGAAGDWQIDSNGEYVISHPVDQGVALALCVKAGSIRAAKNVGNKLHLVTLGAKDEKGQVEDAVKTAVPLASFIADGSVVIRQIAYDASQRGRLLVSVTYENTLLKRVQTITTP